MAAIEIVDVTDEARFGLIPPCADPGVRPPNLRLLGGRRSRVEGEPAELAAGAVGRLGRRLGRRFDRRRAPRANPFAPPPKREVESVRAAAQGFGQSVRAGLLRAGAQPVPRRGGRSAGRQPVRAAAPRPPDDRRRGAAQAAAARPRARHLRQLRQGAARRRRGRGLLPVRAAFGVPARAANCGSCTRSCPTPRCRP